MKSAGLSIRIIAMMVVSAGALWASGQEQPDAGSARPGGVQARQGVQLRWKFEKGRILDVQMRQELHRIENSAGRISEHSSISTTFMKWNVDSVGEDQLAKVFSTVERVTAEITQPDGKILLYDSADPVEPGSPTERVSRSFQPMLGVKTETTMKPTGEVLDVRIPKEALSSLAGGGAGLDGESLRKLMTESSPAFPESVSSGDSWERNSAMKLPFGRMLLKSTYQYAGTVQLEGRELHRIDTRIEISFEVDSSQRGVKVDLIEQNNQGEILFDNTDGRMVSTTIGQDITMEVHTGSQISTQNMVQKVTTTFQETK